MSLAYLFDSNIQFQDRSGNNNVNGFLRVYIDNTDDRAVTYKDFNGTLNQDDIRIDNNGRAVVIVDDSKTYRLEVYGTTGVLLWTLYPISPKATGINETLEALVAAVKSHTIAIEGLALGKKNKQQAKVISGTPTQTVKSVSQNADGEITVEFDDIAFPHKVLVDGEDSVPKRLEDAIMADEQGKLKLYVGENEDSTPENPNKVLVIDDSVLRKSIDDNTQRIENLEETIDEMDVDSVPRAYLASTLNQSPGDNVSTRTTIDVFSVTAIEGECFEFEQTTVIDDIPFGYVWVEQGTYLINAAVTLQWVGNPRGTFIAKVGKVMGENFDFSQEQEISRQSTKVVTIPNRMKLAVNVTYDAGTPVMGFWIQSMQVVKLAGGMSQTNIVHDVTLVGQGSVADPLGVTPAVFGKIKDISTSISQFRTGDVVPVDGPNGPAKMPTSDLQDAILGGPIDEVVQNWLDEHPEATTTVEDNSITDNKLNTSIKFTRSSGERNLGYKILAQGLPLSSQITEINTIYEIRWAFLLEDADYVVIPDGCELKFNGGSIVGGSIEFHDTFLSGDVLIESNWLGRVSNDNVNLRWFGAKEGGTYDCSPAFNRAIYYVNNPERYGTHKVVLKIDSGKWGIGSTINFNGSGEFLIRGDDSNYTTIIPITAMDWMFTNISGLYTGISFEHLRFDGITVSEEEIYDGTKPLNERFNQSYESKAKGAINFPNEYYCLFNNIIFRHFSGTALYFGNFWNVNFYDVTFDSCSVGLRTTQPNGISINNCEFNTIKDFGILAKCSFIFDVHNNIFEIIGKAAILFSSGGIGSIRYNYFETCAIDGCDVYDYNNNNVLYHVYSPIVVGHVFTSNSHVSSGGPHKGFFTIEGNSFQLGYPHSDNDCCINLGNCGRLEVSQNDILALDVPIIGMSCTLGIYINNLTVEKNTASVIQGGYRTTPVKWNQLKCFANDGQGKIYDVIVDNDEKYHQENISKYLYQYLYSNRSFTSTGEVHNGDKVYQTAVASTVFVRQNYNDIPIINDLSAAGNYIVVVFERMNMETGNWRYFTSVLDGTFSWNFSLDAGVKFTMPKFYFLSGSTKDRSDYIVNIPSMALALNGWGFTAHTGDVVNITKDPNYVSAKMMSNGIYKKTLTSGIVEYSPDINDAVIGDKAFKTDAPKKPLWYDGSQWIDGAGNILT